MNLTPWVIGWTVLAAAVVVLMIYRWAVTNQEDDSLHVSAAETAAVEKQVAVAKKLAKVDLWAKILTGLAAIYALVLLGLYLYKGWIETSGATFS